MAHVHLPDGILPLNWVIYYWLASVGLLGIVLIYFRRNKQALDVATLTAAAGATALAIVIFQVELPIFGGIHLNFTPMLGILIGPIFGAISAIIVNIFSAGIGHGGWGPIGLNFLINLTEILIGFLVFAGLFRRHHSKPFFSALMAAFLGLTASNVIMIGAVMVSGIQGTGKAYEELANLWLLGVVNEAAATIEAVITGFLVAFLARVKPELIGAQKIEEP